LGDTFCIFMSSPRKNVRKRRAGQVKTAARVLGVTERHARRLSDAELADVKTLQGAKLRKVQLECRRIENQLQVDAGILISKDKVREQGMKLGAVVAACLDALVSVLPGQLEGLQAAQMAPVIEKEVQKARSAMADACAGL
jgi:hypothetical protein